MKSTHPADTAKRIEDLSVQAAQAIARQDTHSALSLVAEVNTLARSMALTCEPHSAAKPPPKKPRQQTDFMADANTDSGFRQFRLLRNLLRIRKS